MVSYAPFCTTEQKHIVKQNEKKSRKEVEMGIDETVKRLCDHKNRDVTIGVKFSNNHVEMIDRKAKEIGNNATRSDVIRGALIATGVIE